LSEVYGISAGSGNRLNLDTTSSAVVPKSESYMSHLSTIWVPYMSHIGATLSHIGAQRSEVASEADSCLWTSEPALRPRYSHSHTGHPTYNQDQDYNGNHDHDYIYTQGIPDDADGDAQLHCWRRYQCCPWHSSCLTHLLVNPSLVCHSLVICSQNSLILCNFLCD